jgi:hypothetical protein
MDWLQELVRLHRLGTGAREVARLLGMGRNTERPLPAVTHAHYIKAGTSLRARTRRVAGKVGAALAIAPEPANDHSLDCATSVRAAGNR